MNSTEADARPALLSDLIDLVHREWLQKQQSTQEVRQTLADETVRPDRQLSDVAEPSDALGATLYSLRRRNHNVKSDP